MYLIYIDESGKPDKSNHGPFILSALIVHESIWMDLEAKVDDIKKKYFPGHNPNQIELHAKDILHLRSEGYWSCLSKNQNYDLFQEIYSLISNTDCKIISVIVDKEKIRKPTLDLEEWGFKILYERVCYALFKINKSNELPEYAMFILDAIQPKYDKKVRAKILKYFKYGSEHAPNKYLIEDPIFSESHWKNHCQLVDCIALCVRRNFMFDPKKPSITNSKFKEFYSLIEKRFNKDKHGNIPGAGLVIFPRN